jgi:hypothetical protein
MQVALRVALLLSCLFWFPPLKAVASPSSPALVELGTDLVPTFANSLRVHHSGTHIPPTLHWQSRGHETNDRMAPRRKTIQWLRPITEFDGRTSAHAM